MHRLRRLVDRVARGITPRRTDTVLAALLTLLVAAHLTFAGSNQRPADIVRSWWVSAVAGFVMAIAVAWRRRRPFEAAAVAVLAVAVACLIGLAVHGQSPQNNTPDPADLAGIILLYSAVRYAVPNWQRVAAWLGAMAASAIGNLSAADGVPYGQIASNSILWSAVAALGLAFRYRADLRGERSDQARTSEREQLARELHDVVAHHVSAMVVQASAALAVLDKQPEAARPALQFIKTSGQQTMGEMRQMVGILRGAEAAELAPRRGIAGLDDLLAPVPGTLPVSMRVHGEPRPVDASVDQSVHRIVQEAVTNARRHGRSATRIDVDLEWADGSVTVVVANDGTTVADPGPSEGGYGLVGMAERARLVGGTFDAGPQVRGGWTVRATLPLDAELGPTP